MINYKDILLSIYTDLGYNIKKIFDILTGAKSNIYGSLNKYYTEEKMIIKDLCKSSVNNYRDAIETSFSINNIRVIKLNCPIYNYSKIYVKNFYIFNSSANNYSSLITTIFIGENFNIESNENIFDFIKFIYVSYVKSFINIDDIKKMIYPDKIIFEAYYFIILYKLMRISVNYLTDKEIEYVTCQYNYVYSNKPFEFYKKLYSLSNDYENFSEIDNYIFNTLESINND